MTRKKIVKKKIEIVFDPQKRKEFLTGFHKRKNERKKRAKEQLERNIKGERVRIRQEIKEGIKHMKKSFEPLKELTEEDKANDVEYEDDDVKVKIVELSTNEMAQRYNLMGENRGTAYSDEAKSETDPDESFAEDKTDTNRIPGMELNQQSKKSKLNRKNTDNEEHSAKNDLKAAENDKSDIKTKKELDRLKKNKTLKKLKKSKVFKAKERLEKKVNQKKAKRDRNNTLKSLPKNQRKKIKFEPSRYSKGRMIPKKQFRKKKGN